MILVEVWRIVIGGDAEEVGRVYVPGIPAVGNSISAGGRWWSVVHVDMVSVEEGSMGAQTIKRGERYDDPIVRLFVGPYEGGYFL